MGFRGWSSGLRAQGSGLTSKFRLRLDPLLLLDQCQLLLDLHLVVRHHQREELLLLQTHARESERARAREREKERVKERAGERERGGDRGRQRACACVCGCVERESEKECSEGPKLCVGGSHTSSFDMQLPSTRSLKMVMPASTRLVMMKFLVLYIALQR